MKEKVSTKDLSEAFKGITDSILSSVDKETGESYPELIERIKDYESAEYFDLLFMFPLRNSIDLGVMKRFPNISRDNIDRIGFIYSNYRFVESNIEKIIQRREGSACCADKSRYVTNALIEYYGNNKPLGLPYDDVTDKLNKVYWKPHFWDDTKWLQFFLSLVSFWYGNPALYLEFMKDNLEVFK